jgi:myo-inositol-1(or 4)-monophosphatase
MTGTDPDDTELIDIATKAAHEAGSLVSSAQNGALELTTKSSPTDFVTQVDCASERLIREIILTARPEDGMVGEEGTQRPSRSGVSWLVDPIDGTTNYLRGLPNYSISIAARRAGRTVAGVVYDPTLDETFSATQGQGAARNGQPISCSRAVFAGAIIGTGFSYSSPERARQAEVLRALLPAIGDIRRPGSAAISLCWVACGRLDAFYEVGLKPWDFAAGALIAAEAGADVEETGLAGRPGPLVIVSAPSLTARLRSMLNP